MEIVASSWSSGPPLGPFFQLALGDERRGQSVARQMPSDQVLWQSFFLELRRRVGVGGDESHG
jgi:hypothetical protein